MLQAQGKAYIQGTSGHPHLSGSLGAGFKHKWAWYSPWDLPVIVLNQLPWNSNSDLATVFMSSDLEQSWPEPPGDWSLCTPQEGFKVGRWEEHLSVATSEGQASYPNSSRALPLTSMSSLHSGNHTVEEKWAKASFLQKCLFSSRLIYLINTLLIRETQKTFVGLNTYWKEEKSLFILRKWVPGSAFYTSRLLILFPFTTPFNPRNLCAIPGI